MADYLIAQDKESYLFGCLYIRNNNNKNVQQQQLSVWKIVDVFSMILKKNNFHQQLIQPSNNQAEK